MSTSANSGLQGAATKPYLSRFFQDFLHFVPTPNTLLVLEKCLARADPDLMKQVLRELSETQPHIWMRPRQIQHAIFTVYNRKVAEQGALFPMFHAFETAFRSFVAVILQEHYGEPDWWDPIYQAKLQGQPATSVRRIGARTIDRQVVYAIGKAVDNAMDESRTLPTFIADGFQLLREAKLVTIERLISAHWTTAFRHRLPSRQPNGQPLWRADFEAKFTKVRRARNDAYHHKPVSVRPEIIAAIEELLDYIDVNLHSVDDGVRMAFLSPPIFQVSPELRHVNRDDRPVTLFFMEVELFMSPDCVGDGSKLTERRQLRFTGRSPVEAMRKAFGGLTNEERQRAGSIVVMTKHKL